MSKIFIAIPSFRDPTLIRTLKSAIDNAERPHMLSFAIGLQYYEDEMPDLSFIPAHQLKTLSWNPDDRPGLSRVRYLLTALYGKEDYFLMSDSHMYFEKDWDTKLMSLMQSAEKMSGHDNNILMVQSPMTDPDGRPAINDQTFSFIPYSLVGLNSPHTRPYYLLPMPINNVSLKFDALAKTTTWRNGGVFTHGRFINEVGLDQYSQITHEEAYLSYRSFMLGWNTYQYNDVMLTHDPKDYYDAIWPDPATRGAYNKSIYVDDDLVHHEFAMAFIYNNYSRYAIPNSVREPKEYWEANGQGKFYDYVKSIADKFLYNELRA